MHTRCDGYCAKNTVGIGSQGAFIKLIALSLLLSNGAIAQSSISCPDKIYPTGVELNTATKAAGWATHVSDMPIWLTNVSVYDGPVAQNGALVPNALKGREEYWDFKNHPGVIFLSCEYANGVFKLSKLLPQGVLACKVSVQKSSSTGMLQGGFICW